MKPIKPKSNNITNTPDADRESSSSGQELLSAMRQAALLARQGRYLQAEKLLGPLVESDNSSIDVVDLMARIYAQQGKFKQAQSLWIKLLQKDPTNLHILSALKACATYTRPGFESFILTYTWLIVSILLWFIIVIAVIASI